MRYLRCTVEVNRWDLLMDRKSEMVRSLVYFCIKNWVVSVPVTETRKRRGAERTRKEFQTFRFELVKFKNLIHPSRVYERDFSLGTISILIVVKAVELNEFSKRENLKRRVWDQALKSTNS